MLSILVKKKEEKKKRSWESITFKIKKILISSVLDYLEPSEKSQTGIGCDIDAKHVHAM